MSHISSSRIRLVIAMTFWIPSVATVVIARDNPVVVHGLTDLVAVCEQIPVIDREICVPPFGVSPPAGRT